MAFTDFKSADEVQKAYQIRYQDQDFFSSIVADEILTGTPDYVVAKRSPLGKNVLDVPIVLIAEAKQNDFARGWGQCLAEMIAAQRLNGNPECAIYGIVTAVPLENRTSPKIRRKRDRLMG